MKDRLLILDLFSGPDPERLPGGWGSAFRERGHDVVTVDNDPRSHADVLSDVMDIGPECLPRFDGVLASPPCGKFTVLRIAKNWTPPPENAPRNEEAMAAVRLVEHTLALIRSIAPRFWVMENPRAKLRSLPVMRPYERRTVTMCSFGARWQKPTDLWGGFPPSLILPFPCHPGDPCHVPAPRGSVTGLQGSDSKNGERARIPYSLSLAVCLAMERDL